MMSKVPPYICKKSHYMRRPIYDHIYMKVAKSIMCVCMISVLYITKTTPSYIGVIIHTHTLL